jgi:hypothetical protein
MRTADDRELSRARRIWFSGFAVLFALIFGLGFFGWVFLVTGWFASGDEQIHRVHDLGAFGVAIGLFTATPLLIVSWRRTDTALLQMLGVAAIATVMGSAVAADLPFMSYAVIVAVPLVILLAISRGWKRYVEAGDGWDGILVAIALVASPFWVGFALSMARLQRAGPSSDPHVEMHHWTGMAVMAIAMVLMGLLASLRTPGWRIVAWLTGLGSVVYGLASAVFATYPGNVVPYAGSEGSVWGALAIAWGVALIGAAEVRARAA